MYRRFRLWSAVGILGLVGIALEVLPSRHLADVATASAAAAATDSTYVYVLHSDGSVFERPSGIGSCSSVRGCPGYTQVDRVGSSDVAIAANNSEL